MQGFIKEEGKLEAGFKIVDLDIVSLVFLATLDLKEIFYV